MTEGESTTTDYVVVGAGSAGSVVTRRLLDAGFSVHVLEAGPVDTDANIHSPQGWPALLGGPQDWAVTTEPQKHANNRSLFWPRGKVLGGSSSLNGMIYIRGHRSDYDGWAAAGCTGWDWDSVFPLFLRSEEHEDGASEYHGGDGPLHVSKVHRPNPTAQAFVDAAKSAGHKEIEDFNGEQMVGVGFNHMTTKDGERASAWKSFVKPLGDHPKLTVTTGALVTRILLDDGRATGVEYVTDGSHQALATREVVVSAGTIGSPKLLLLSGIGPAEHLREVGVEVEVDLPGVGENLHDHLLLSNIYESKKPVPAGENNLLEAQFYAYSSGATTEAPDLQPLFLHLVYPAESYPVPAQGYTIAPGLVAPKSRGTLRLASNDPAIAPLVDPNILSDPYDLEAMVDAVELCREIGQAAAFDEWRGAEVAPDPSATTREELREYVRRAVGTYHHQVGTCKMGDPGTDASVVVTPELKVVGVQGLRVIDASIIPTVPAGNTNAPSIMIGEKGSDLLLNGASA